MIISPVPFGGAMMHALINAGILPQSTPEFREGMLHGEMVGGILCLVWGAGKGPSTSPSQPPRPAPATAGGAPSPPLVVVPNGSAVAVGAAGAVTLTVAVTDLGVTLTGPGKQKSEEHHIATDKNKKAGQQWTKVFQDLFDNAGVSLQDPRNKVLVVGHQGRHPNLYHEAIYERLSKATDGLTGDAARDALLKELDALGKEVATPGTMLNNLVTKGSP